MKVDPDLRCRTAKPALVSAVLLPRANGCLYKWAHQHAWRHPRSVQESKAQGIRAQQNIANRRALFDLRRVTQRAIKPRWATRSIHAAKRSS